MRRRSSLLRRLAAEQKAATAVEYGLILALVVLAVVGAFQTLGQQTGSMWNNVSAKVVAAG